MTPRAVSSRPRCRARSCVPSSKPTTRSRSSGGARARRSVGSPPCCSTTPTPVLAKRSRCWRTKQDTSWRRCRSSGPTSSSTRSCTAAPDRWRDVVDAFSVGRSLAAWCVDDRALLFDAAPQLDVRGGVGDRRLSGRVVTDAPRRRRLAPGDDDATTSTEPVQHLLRGVDTGYRDPSRAGDRPLAGVRRGRLRRRGARSRRRPAARAGTSRTAARPRAPHRGRRDRGRDGRRLRHHPRVAGEPAELRAAAVVVPGAQAPGRRHARVARGRLACRDGLAAAIDDERATSGPCWRAAPRRM